MSSNRRPIFRDTAIQKYMQNRDRDVLPRFVSPPVFVFCWIFFALCLTAGFLAWNFQVPVYDTGIGFIASIPQPAQAAMHTNQSQEAMAIIFVSSDIRASLRVGQAVTFQVGSHGPTLTLPVSVIDATVLSPADVRKLYGVPIVTSPSVVVLVPLGTRVSLQTYADTLIQPQIQVGSQRILSLIPGINHFIGA